MATKQAKHPDSALRELFVNELQDILWAEKYLVKNLPKLAKGATSEELKAAFEKHLEETEGHVQRLEQVFSVIGEKVTTKKCLAMDGLVKEAKELLDDTDAGTSTRDVALISAAQKVEHYEIASYGTLRTLASQLGLDEAAVLLNQTLSEEKKTDELLTELAESSVDVDASQE
ncbi:YciE/YciF ferroxidase family protein [Arsenicibacter rosenii]|nr:ferritin-like domain-containing protein [Arsenicibacter rosenii]